MFRIWYESRRKQCMWEEIRGQTADMEDSNTFKKWNMKQEKDMMVRDTVWQLYLGERVLL